MIRSFIAREDGDGVALSLEPGDPIESYSIHRNGVPDPDGCVYVMTFQCRGRRLRCPLVRFQARTEPADHRTAEVPAREAASIH